MVMEASMTIEEIAQLVLIVFLGVIMIAIYRSPLI
jgi:hypothetical protein